MKTFLRCNYALTSTYKQANQVKMKIVHPEIVHNQLNEKKNYRPSCLYVKSLDRHLKTGGQLDVVAHNKRVTLSTGHKKTQTAT